MRHGDESDIVVNSTETFGETGSAEFNIPANVSVSYTIKLNEIEPEIATWKYNEEESLEHALLQKERGTKYLKDGKLRLSIKIFNKSNSYLSNYSEF